MSSAGGHDSQPTAILGRSLRSAFGFLIAGTVAAAAGSSRDWPVYGGDFGGTRHSPLKEINTSNVHLLRPAWIFRCDDMREQPPTTIECNPLVIAGVMYLTTPALKVVALDAATGARRWDFDPWEGRRGGGVNRGVVWWSEGHERRLFSAAGSFIWALDPETGRPVRTFGHDGHIDLREDIDRELVRQSITMTSPGVVYRDLLIVGSTVDDSPAATAPGHIRAYDVRTGARRWIFHTIPHPGEVGYETWPPDAWKTVAACNAWGGLTLDVARGLVFCGTGSPAYDHYGGDRPGQNLFGNCVLALDALTGARRWHFQIVHHDLWDYDLPCPPVLVSVNRGGRRVDAAAQATKTGNLFLFERETGRPIFPIEERPVLPSDLPGEAAWPTQPFPSKPPAFAMQGFREEDVTDLSPAARDAVRAQLKEIHPAPLFAPPSLQARAVQPQFNGGAEWSGSAFDPDTGCLYLNASNEAEWLSMVPAKPANEVSLHALGRHLFGAMCVQCHGAQKFVGGDSTKVVDTSRTPPAPPPAAAVLPAAGATNAPTPVPSLTGLKQRLAPPDAGKLLETGRGQMPSFASLSPLERRALVAFLYGEGQDELLKAGEIDLAWADRIRFLATGHHDFRDPEGWPVNRRPWGTLAAIDLSTGEFKWQVPLGTYPELERRGLPPTGTFNIGGPIVTDGGLVFIGATRDERFRAFDRKTGKVLWEFQLDAGGYATPATYEVNGRQYVVIAAGGGGKPETKPGNAYWCFALPKR